MEKKKVNETKKKNTKETKQVKETKKVKEEIKEETKEVQEEKIVNNDKRNKILKIVGIVVAIVAIFTLTFFASNLRKSKEPKSYLVSITYDDYLELLNGDVPSVIFLGHPTCTWCQKYTPVIKSASSTYHTMVYYLNTDTLGEQEYYGVIASSKSLSEEGGIATPTTLVVANGKEIDYISGYVETDTVVDLFKRNNLMDFITEITYDEYLDILDSDELSAILLAKPTCSWCQKYKPVLREVANENMKEVYYLDTSKLTSEQYANVIKNSPAVQKESKTDIPTPTTILVRDGKEISGVVGYIEKDKVNSFLKENGFINE